MDRPIRAAVHVHSSSSTTTRISEQLFTPKHWPRYILSIASYALYNMSTAVTSSVLFPFATTSSSWTSSEISSSVPRSCTRKRARLGEQSQGSDRHVKRLRLGDNGAPRYSFTPIQVFQPPSCCTLDYWARNNLKVYVLPPETSKHSREGT